MDKIQRELEFSDISPAVLNIHSLAGGTGSGLGTGITEEIADVYGNLARLNIVIAPYHFEFGQTWPITHPGIASLPRSSRVRK